MLEDVWDLMKKIVPLISKIADYLEKKNLKRKKERKRKRERDRQMSGGNGNWEPGLSRCRLTNFAGRQN